MAALAMILEDRQHVLIEGRGFRPGRLRKCRTCTSRCDSEQHHRGWREKSDRNSIHDRRIPWGQPSLLQSRSAAQLSFLPCSSLAH